MWRDDETGEVAKLHADIRAMRPLTTFPETITEEMIGAAGFTPVLQVVPQYDALMEKAVMGDPVMADGQWTQTWDIQPLYATPAELAAALASAKRAKEIEINQWRDAANSGTFPYAGKLIDVDALSYKDITSTAAHIALFGVFPESFPGAWKTADNTYIPMPSIDDFKAMYSAMTQQGAANFNNAQALKMQVANATTLQGVAAIRW